MPCGLFRIWRRVGLAAWLIAAAGAAPAAEGLRTRASLEVREAAGITITSSAPLRLLLTSGTATSFTVTITPTNLGVPASENLDVANADALINGSGFVPATTSSGEVLSVSMSSALVNRQDIAPRGPVVQTVLAQFN